MTDTADHTPDHCDYTWCQAHQPCDCPYAATMPHTRAGCRYRRDDDQEDDP
jgi:hypothetical protein